MSRKKPIFHFVTLFPETIRVWLTTSILGRALNAGLFDFSLYQLRDYSSDRHKSVDDAAYGGGGGMVMRIEPLVAAVEAVWEKVGKENSRVIYFSPVGDPMTHRLIRNLTSASITNFIFICGHYEGVDQRFIDHWVDQEISLGDFVLTGGELPAVALADAMIRQLEGALGNDEGKDHESFSLRDKYGYPLLEYPHYTRPSEFRGHGVPPVLLSGDHQKVAEWRRLQSQKRTQLRRPELFEAPSKHL